MSNPHDPHAIHLPPTSFFRKYILSYDHKVIAVQFTFVSLLFVIFGGLLALGVRYQLAWPNQNVPYADIDVPVLNHLPVIGHFFKHLSILPGQMTSPAPEANLALWKVGQEVKFPGDAQIDGKTIPADTVATLTGFNKGLAVTVPAYTIVQEPDGSSRTLTAPVNGFVPPDAVVADYDYTVAPRVRAVVGQVVDVPGPAGNTTLILSGVEKSEPGPTGDITVSDMSSNVLLPLTPAGADPNAGTQVSLRIFPQQVEGKTVPAGDYGPVSASKVFFYKQALTTDGYLQLFTMHATIMIFFVLMPMLLGGFGNFLIPLMIGARDMAFPKLNALSFWLSVPAGLIMLTSFWVTDGPAGGGWTMYPPLSAGAAFMKPHLGTTLWVVAIALVGFSTIVGTLNYITTVINMRAPGMTMFRMPLTVWSLFITAILGLLATPVLTAAAIMLCLDRVAGTHFFDPNYGGQVLMWQHLFWFFGHPEVYILILPAMGIVSDILSTNARKPVFGYKPMVFAMAAISCLGFIVWGHHMFNSGMNPAMGTTFMASTIMIAVPSAIKTFNWLGTLWGGNIRFTTSMLFAIGFVAMFVIGGLSGIFMASAPVDIHVHGTYFIVAHIHYVFFGGTVFAVFAGIYHWFPKIFGRRMNEKWGVVHFTFTIIAYNGTFFLMHILGIGGAPRRYASHMENAITKPLQPLNVITTIFALMLGMAQIPFFYNFWVSLPRKLGRAMAAVFIVAMTGPVVIGLNFWSRYNPPAGEDFNSWLHAAAQPLAIAFGWAAVWTVAIFVIVWVVWAVGGAIRMPAILQRLLYIVILPAFLLPALIKHDMYLGFGHPDWYAYRWVLVALAAVPGLIYLVVVRPRDEFGFAAGDNPWESNGLEWSTSSPPPFHNFDDIPTVHRGPYEYSSPAVEEDYLPQRQQLAPGIIEPTGH